MVVPAAAAEPDSSTWLLAEEGGSGEEGNEENGEREGFEKKGVLEERRRRGEDVCVSNLLSIFAISKISGRTKFVTVQEGYRRET